MKTKDVIARLEDFPRDMEVFVSEDPEGNSFSPLEDIDESYFDIDNREAYHPDDVESEYEDTPDNLDKVLIIWP